MDHSFQFWFLVAVLFAAAVMVVALLLGCLVAVVLVNSGRLVRTATAHWTSQAFEGHRKRIEELRVRELGEQQLGEMLSDIRPLTDSRKPDKVQP